MFHDPGSLWLVLANLYSSTSRQQHFNDCSHIKVAVIQLNYALSIPLRQEDGQRCFLLIMVRRLRDNCFSSESCEFVAWLYIDFFFINNHSRDHTRQWQVLLAPNVFPARAIFNYHMAPQWYSLSPLVYESGQMNVSCAKHQSCGWDVSGNHSNMGLK